MRLHWIAGVLFSAWLGALAGCGGSDRTEDILAEKPNCPAVHVDDVWINERLGCTSPGEQFISISANAGGPRVNRAYVVAQQAYDLNFVLLNQGRIRFFKSFLCVRNLPNNVDSDKLAQDLQFNLELGAYTPFRPREAGATALLFYDGFGVTPYVDVPCDPALHPVIVDYATGLVESVNAGALAAIQIYDHL